MNRVNTRWQHRKTSSFTTTITIPLQNLQQSKNEWNLRALTLELDKIVVFADESVFVEHVEFLSGGQLFAAEDARETFEMVDASARSSHQFTRTDLLLTTTALRAEPPAHDK